MIKDGFGKDWLLKDMQLCVGKGWGLIIEKFYWLCDAHGVVVVQVKEKFGGLRLYVGDAPSCVHLEIDALEKESLFTCETCGNEGSLKTKGGWHSVRCENCP